jgi:GH43 family beta-xylosidase
MQRRRLLALVVALVAACADDVASNTPDASPALDAPMLDAPARDAPDIIVVADARSPDAPPDVPSRDVAPPDAPVAARCRTRVTYGEAWIRPAGHDEAFDEVDGLVTWDGVCTDDGANSYAALSNGWRPYFTGNGRCAIALDTSNCAGASGACATRFTYGPAWSHPTGHPTQHDDVGGLAAWDGVCHRDGASSFAVLSNGWRPYFRGGLCAVSVRQTQCGDRYVNPVIGGDCPDPGVLRDGSDYYLVCTSGNAADAFPMRASRDLVHWRAVGPVFPAARRPAWAASDFWAPEIHRVGARYVVYYTARRAGGQLAIGAASAPTPTGPYTDLGRPLLEDASMGLIDATAFRSMDGSLYLYWKDDGNARGRPTPIHGQRLAADGLSLTGARATLLTNDLPWEGALIEGPWVISHDGAVYLFYSANAYYDGRYAVGVARASSPLGPFVKRGAPILVTNAAFAGPGHGSVVDGPSGESVFVYHAWRAGFAGVAGNGRAVLVDRVAWSGGWPSLPGAPSSAPQALP